ncbi:MAG: SRPBCC domain-containing protein [Bacteroidota bacterium]
MNGKHEFKGKILQLEPGKLFQYSSWSKISKLPDKPENYSLIEFRLTPMEDQTTLSVTHSNLIAKAAVEHSNFYWNVALGLIRRLTEQ